uniref:Uncharacterized protein n=1 Tax=Arundo donax TaxID=35708 RepID=A0A0A8YSV4_ARUDO
MYIWCSLKPDNREQASKLGGVLAAVLVGWGDNDGGPAVALFTWAGTRIVDGNYESR